MTRTGLALAAAERIPPSVWRPLARVGGAAAALRPPRALRQWQLNAQTITGQAPTRRQTAAAAASWARNLAESAQLSRWSAQDVLSTVLISDEDRTRLVEAHRAGGAVVALPHMGSWDLAGAWACLNGLPVATVAEQIPEFEYFVRVRERLGFRVYGLGQPDLMARLEADQRAGRMSCLLSDRYFGRGGVDVAWPTADGPVPGRMPAGAAQLSLATGATLFGAASHYRGTRMQLVISTAISGPDVPSRNQALATFFATQIRAHVTDWHMLQPFFTGVRAA